MFGNSEEETAELYKGGPLSDPKSEALRVFTIALYENQGRVSDEELETFLNAGFSRAQALDVVANIAVKVMANFTNQLAGTPVSERFEELAEGISFEKEDGE